MPNATKSLESILTRSIPGKRFTAYVWSHLSGWVRGGQFESREDADLVVRSSAGEVFDNVERKPVLRIAPTAGALDYANAMGISVREWRGAITGTESLGGSILPANWDARQKGASR